MEGQIRISPSMMKQRSNEYKAQADNIQSVIDTMKSLIGELQTEWEGQASAAFASQFQELLPSFIQMENLVETISKQLYQTGQSMEDMDKDISTKFGTM